MHSQISSSKVSAPAVNVTDIKSECERMGGLPPVLWIEEMDKVNFTETNHRWLFTLVNCVYTLGGCVVATTNDSKAALDQKLGEGIIGRLDGSRDGGELFVVKNFSPLKKK